VPRKITRSKKSVSEKMSRSKRTPFSIAMARANSEISIPKRSSSHPIASRNSPVEQPMSIARPERM
jgi:hypothetical protein